MVTPTTSSQLARLKAILQTDLQPGQFEKLAAALVSALTGVGVAVAANGFQHGGDGGPAGREGRRFRIETKRYSDTTALSNRELLGEIDHAIARDPAIEGWFLVATRSVPEQLENELLAKSGRTGVPVMVFDWKDDHFPTLAALCTAAPNGVGTFAGKEAEELSAALEEAGRDTLERLRREAAHWCLGFESIRTSSHDHLNQLWSDPRFAAGTFGQNIAAGASSGTIARPRLSCALEEWWAAHDATTRPALVLGHEGVGKTWATVAWLVGAVARLPITLLIPASAFADNSVITAYSLRQFLAERMQALVGRHSVDLWTLRLEHLLHRPVQEGPALLVFIDGMNQQPTVQWQRVLSTLQMPEFVGRIRVVASTRRFHFEDRLGGLRALLDGPVTVEVGNFDDSPGGELDQRLTQESLTRQHLGPDLLPYAKVPRLFSLVVKFRGRLVQAEQITVHRLLWEYGRDSLGVRGGASFSEQEWRSWLRMTAQDRLDGRERYSVASLSERAARADLSPADISRRLSDLVDAPFMRRTADSDFELDPMLVYHALGLALLTRIQGIPADTEESLASVLDGFLDPIAGLDEKAEILRAAVSIAIDITPKTGPDVTAALVSAWLSTQNVPQAHWTELGRIADALVDPLLRAIDDIAAGNHAARVVAVKALRGVRKDADLTTSVIKHAATWIRRVPRDVVPNSARDPEADKRRSLVLTDRIGTDANGPQVVLGMRIELVHHRAAPGLGFIPALLEGLALAEAASVFEALAVHQAVRGHSEIWSAMKWLVLFNEVDHDATVQMLRSASDEMHLRRCEAYIDERLPKRAAALLRWLTSDELDEPQAHAIDPPGFYGSNLYATEYLSDPADNFFVLERRHVGNVLERSDIPLERRIQRCVAYLTDPRLELPAKFVAEVRDLAEAFDVSRLDLQQVPDRADLDFQELSVAFARCAPDQLAAIHRRKLEQLASRGPASRFGSALSITGSYLLANAASRAAAQRLRESSCDQDEDREAFASGRLLLIELEELPALEQYRRLVKARLKYVSDDIQWVLKPLSEDDWAALSREFEGSTSSSRDMLFLLHAHPASIIGMRWEWVMSRVGDAEEDVRNAAFRLLFEADGQRFGRSLLRLGWSWEQGKGEWVNHFGSLALIAGSQGVPFDQLAERIAPWLLLHAAQERGVKAAEVELAAQIVDRLLVRTPLAVDGPQAKLIVNEEARARDPYSFSVAFEPDGISDLERLKSFANSKQQAEVRQRAVESIKARIESTRAAGGSLYLRSLGSDDFEAVIDNAPDYIDSWLEGADGRTAEFARRVSLSDGAYVALCEALLQRDDARGTVLWKALDEVLNTNFLGRAKLDRMVHAILRAPQSPASDALLESLVDLGHLNTDSGLLDLTIACAINSRQPWLSHVVEADESSGRAWRIQRARQLKALRVGNVDLDGGEWPHGEMIGTARFEAAAFRTRHSEAASRHWWCRYWEAEGDEDAFAAWTLFLRVVDRRALAWMAPAPAANARRLVHFRLQESLVKRAMEVNEKELNSCFLGQKTSTLVRPWLSLH